MAASDVDPELIERIARGEEAALTELYRALEGPVYQFALSRLSEPFDAADVLNEVMLEVWRSAGRFEGRARVSTWVLGIANHKVMDRMRRRGRDPVHEPDETQPDEDSPATAELIAATQDAARLRECLQRLSDAHRQVVHLAFFEDRGYNEVAEIAECPPGTVKTRMYHAKRLLRQCLESLGAGE